MPIDLAKAVGSGGGGVPIGGVSRFARSPDAAPLLEVNGETFLRAGHVIVGEKDAYLEAHANFANGWASDFDRPVSSELSTTVFSDAAFGNGMYVLVAEGDVFTSADAITWTRRSPPFPLLALRVVFGNGVFVVVGEGGWVGMSTNGIAWTTSQLSMGTNDFSGVAFGGGVFVAVGAAGNIWHSADGVSWTKAANISTSYTYTDIAFGASVFVAVGNSGVISRSADGGVTWGHKTSSNSTFSTNMIYRIAAGADGTFVATAAAGFIGTSTDGGNNWVQQTRLGTTAVDVCAYTSADGFIAVNTAGALTRSPDGLNWTVDSTVYTEGQAFRRLLVAGSTLIAGTFGRCYQGVGLSSLVRTDVPYQSAIIYAVAQGNGVMVAVGGRGLVASSTDGGITWTRRALGLVSVNLFGVAFGNGVFIAGGESLATLRSVDGINWTATMGAATTENTIRDVAYGDGVWVMPYSTYGYCRRSVDDGLTWTLYTITATTGYFNSPSYYASKVSFSGGRFIFTGYTSDSTFRAYFFHVTSDGLKQGSSCSAANIRGTGNVLCRCHYVAPDGSIYTGWEDGVIWRITITSTGISGQICPGVNFGTDGVHGIGYGKGTFVAVGRARKVVSSTDGFLSGSLATYQGAPTIIYSLNYMGDGFTLSDNLARGCRKSWDAVGIITGAPSGNIADYMRVK